MSTTTDFFKADFNSSLFPLKTNLFMCDRHEKEVSEYIYQKILDPTNKADNFLPQQKVYATKPKGHLRRTAKLDPVAEYFIYDLVFRNRNLFRPEVGPTRRSFGYRFQKGALVSVHSAYKAYKAALAEYSAQYKYSIQFDIASYFNSIYHHDLTNWFSALPGISAVDASAFGQYFREINSGRSIDFLPHGIYPCKMIGNEFLKYVDLYGPLKSSVIVRFMDDFSLFGDDESILKRDFVRIQQLLGLNGLNVNPSKTHYNRMSVDVDKKLSAIHETLKEIVTDFVEVPSASGVTMVEVETEVTKKLDKGQVASLTGLLKDESLEEADADMILGFLRSHSDSVLEFMPELLTRYPNQIKHLYTLCQSVTDKTGLCQVIRDFAKSLEDPLEYQLFWLAMIIEDHVATNGPYGDALINLYERTADFKIARAKILEIPEQGFGLKEIRSEYLKTGQSDWLSWASAMGTRTLNVAERNYMLTYFSKGSSLNYLVAECARKF